MVPAHLLGGLLAAPWDGQGLPFGVVIMTQPAKHYLHGLLEKVWAQLQDIVQEHRNLRDGVALGWQLQTLGIFDAVVRICQVCQYLSGFVRICDLLGFVGVWRDSVGIFFGICHWRCLALIWQRLRRG